MDGGLRRAVPGDLLSRLSGVSISLRNFCCASMSSASMLTFCNCIQSYTIECRIIAIVPVLQSLSAMLRKINDDSVKCKKVDVVQIKTVPKFMLVMSVKFALCKNY